MRLVIGLLAACGDDGNMFPGGGFTFPDGAPFRCA
jgi:hypothetical protein